MNTRILIATLAAFLAAQAYGYEFCRYQKDGKKCHSVAVTGGKYCKKHCYQPTDNKSLILAMQAAVSQWSKYNSRSPAGEMTTEACGYVIVVGKDGYARITGRVGQDEGESTMPKTNEEKMEWHFMMALKYMKAAIEEAESRGRIIGESMEEQRKNDFDAAMHGKSLDGKHIYVP